MEVFCVTEWEYVGKRRADLICPEELVLQAVRQNGLALRYASAELQRTAALENTEAAACFCLLASSGTMMWPWQPWSKTVTKL